MSLFDERALRDIVAEELRRVLREERNGVARPANDTEYLPVADAAARAAVAPATIRVWMAQGRLRRYHAGRELRVCSPELAELMRRPPVGAGAGNETDVSPEEAADQYLRRRRLRQAPKKAG
jgi:hypothetical protein